MHEKRRKMNRNHIAFCVCTLNDARSSHSHRTIVCSAQEKETLKECERKKERKQTRPNMSVERALHEQKKYA